MRSIVAFIVASLFLGVSAFPVTASAGITDIHLDVHNASGHEMLVTAHIMIPALYKDRWVLPGKSISFSPGTMDWKGVLYISVRASTSSSIDENSPHICLSSLPIHGSSGRSYTAHYDGHDCKITQD